MKVAYRISDNDSGRIIFETEAVLDDDIEDVCIIDQLFNLLLPSLMQQFERNQVIACVLKHFKRTLTGWEWKEVGKTTTIMVYDEGIL